VSPVHANRNVSVRGVWSVPDSQPVAQLIHRRFGSRRLHRLKRRVELSRAREFNAVPQVGEPFCCQCLDLVQQGALSVAGCRQTAQVVHGCG